MTEDEAKEKWCPFVRQSATFSEGYGFSYNRAMIDNAPESRCIGSACMAWRWHPSFPRLAGHDRKSHKTEQSYQAFLAEHTLWGFCGLGGKP